MNLSEISNKHILWFVETVNCSLTKNGILSKFLNHDPQKEISLNPVQPAEPSLCPAPAVLECWIRWKLWYDLIQKTEPSGARQCTAVLTIPQFLSDTQQSNIHSAFLFLDGAACLTGSWTRNIKSDIFVFSQFSVEWEAWFESFSCFPPEDCVCD